MQRQLRRSFVLFPFCVAMLALAGCGGGGDDDGGDPFKPGSGSSDATATPSGAGNENGGGSGSGNGSLEVGEPSLTADPGQAYVEVEGERLVYEAAGSLYYNCEISSDLARVNFQTAEGQDLAIQAGTQGGGWGGQFDFKAAGGDNVQYNIIVRQSNGRLGVADGMLSYEGPADKIKDFDVTNAQEVDVRLAVNCGAGDAPLAVIDGIEYTFALSGAQSVDCAVSDTDIEITVNRLGLENKQLSIDMRGGPSDWIGSVFIITPDGNFTATLSGEAEGLAIDGNTVTYDGPIEGDGGQVDASVSVTCP